MKYPCTLIKDILPLYHDGITSKESNTAVEAHFAECENCKSYYEKICQSDELEEMVFDEEITNQTAASFKEVSKTMSKKIFKTLFKAILIIVIVMLGIILGLWAWVVSFINKTAADTWETHYDISEYGMLDDGQNLLECDENLGTIWPDELSEDMNVTDYLLIHYNPWDSNYLGYLEVEYTKDDYEAELERLKTYESTDYLGNYGAGEFSKKELLAMYSNGHSFIYALTDGNDCISYVYLMFPGYAMDIDYEDYIPKDCLPKGLDLSKDNPVRQEVLKEREEDLERHKKQIKNSGK